MKTPYYIYTLLLWLSNTLVYSQIADMNYRRQRIMTDESGTEYIEIITYYDGLGRPIETVEKGATPQGRDLISFIEYDRQGREYRQWLPGPGDNATGAFVPPQTLRQSAGSFYNDANLYRQTGYEPSPLNRITRQTLPGAAWETHPENYTYSINTSPVTTWWNNDGTFESVTYPPQNLRITQTADADGRLSREYKDRLGKVVMTEQNDGTQWLQTRYVYDIYDMLAAIVPPQAAGIDDEAYCYYYTYDHRNRMVEKKIPGADWQYFVYDKRDRLCYSQDGNRREESRWIRMQYDDFDRMTTMQLVQTATSISRSSLQDIVNNGGNMFAIQQATLQQMHYDNYPPTLPEELFFSENEMTNASAENNKGRLTISQTAVLGAGHMPGSLLATVYYYDNYNREIQSVAENHLGGIDRLTTQYDFMGNITHTLQESSWTGGSGQTETIAIRREVEYDAQKRPVAVKLRINNRLALQIARMEYDELGRLKIKRLHNNGAETIAYTYNIQNWLKTITGTLFTEELYYEQALGNAAPQYNGNISAQTWATPAQGQHAYTFSYDGVNRLAGTQYKAGNGSFGQLNTEQLTYDRNSNIMTLKRYDATGLIDHLAYQYTGNRVTGITDAATVAGFPLGMTAYAHDANGNAITEGDIGIGYNLLNLPEVITRPGGRELWNIYAADGRKLATVATDGYELLEGTKIYNGNLVFDKNSDLEYILMDEGRILVSNYRTPHLGVIIESPFFSDWQAPDTPNTMKSTSFVYEYHLKDHLGSVRVAFTPSLGGGQGEVVQETAYYPSGSPIAALSYNNPNLSTNRYKREGKEYLNDFDWNKYDFGARTFDTWSLRSLQIDPMSEKYYSVSPYALWGNNPVNAIDPDGMDWKTALDEEIAKKLQKQLTAEVSRLDRKATSIQKDIDKINNNTKLSDEKRAEQSAKKESQLNGINATKEYIADINTQIGALGESSTVYSFNNLGENVTGGYLSSPKEGEIVINHAGGTNSFANQTHETVHATQYEKGLFQRDPKESTKFTFKGNARNVAEVSAYMFQYIVAPNSMPYSVNGRIRSLQDINVKWLRGILDANRKPVYP